MGGTDPTLTETNCCTWRARVICSGGRLQQIYLNENQLNGTITSDIGQLDGLRLFSVAANNLTGELPPEMAKLSFSVLDIDENNFYGQIPAIQVNTSFGTPRFEMYLNSFSGYIPDTLVNTNITTIDPQNNNGCPYDSNLCVKTKPLNCQNVNFNCTTLPHRFYPDSQNSTSDTGLLAHPLKLIIGIVVIVALLALTAIGITYFVSKKKKQSGQSSPPYSSQSPGKQSNEDTRRFVGQQATINPYANERYSKGNFSSGSSETAVSQYSPSLSNGSPVAAGQYPERSRNDTVSTRSSKSTSKSPMQSPRQAYQRDSSRIPGSPMSSVESYHSSPRNQSPSIPPNYPSDYPRKYQSSVGSPLVNSAVIKSPIMTQNAMPPVLFDDSGYAANQAKAQTRAPEPLFEEYEHDGVLPPVIHHSYLQKPDERRDSETLPPVIRQSFLRRHNNEN
ncbi:hypothetical protein HDV06_004818 [Boothiomyces sp. JEL0866]|nr:hypothetical protein HDV06_004818 [Boothiomyces sp. JEL0866]